MLQARLRGLCYHVLDQVLYEDLFIATKAQLSIRLFL